MFFLLAKNEGFLENFHSIDFVKNWIVVYSFPSLVRPQLSFLNWLLATPVLGSVGGITELSPRGSSWVTPIKGWLAARHDERKERSKMPLVFT